MREILFRGKTLDNGEWVEGFYVHANKYYEDLADSHFIVEHGEFDYDNYARYEVDPTTVSQFTGLCDKNGKKIFEGDICQTKGKPLIDEKPFTVEWNDYYSGFFWEDIDNPRKTDMFTKTVAELTEVIGNIYDNSKLLEGET